MTRTFTKRPVWTWKCDSCGFETGDLARQQYGLPHPDVMRDRGWYIADLYGDLCPRCVPDPHDSGTTNNEQEINS